MHRKIIDIQQKAQAKIEEEKQKFQKKAGAKGEGRENLRGLRLTDWGNAERLVALHGQDLRYCYPWSRWLVWDGRRWATDEVGAVEQRAKDVVRSIYQEAAVAGDKKQREALAHHALASESEVKRKALVASARNEPGIPVLPEHLDQAPWLFNVLNGTLDLQSGDLIPHRRADLITKLAPVEYDPQAQCPAWWAFLEKIMNGDGAMMEFLQKAAGYALTGDTREQCLFFLYGLGANGKTTFLETLQALWGDYAKRTSTETFLVKKGNSIPNDVAALRGARLVAAVEVESGRRLAEVLLKEMTGGDTMTARFLRAEFFEFKPEFKIFLAANHKPVIRGTDNGIWRRIHLIPFTVQIPKDQQDKELPAKLRAELPGILNWAVEGCLQWQHEGLTPPPEVRMATNTYREEMDPLCGFIGECCVLTPGAEAMAKDLYKAYTAWAEESGEKQPMSQKEFGGRLKERGLTNSQETRGQNKGKSKWSGIGLRNE
ncbi:MAG: phage/plasmid primase, P4 family [Thermodesulfobacteriota bacterium]